MLICSCCCVLLLVLQLLVLLPLVYLLLEIQDTDHTDDIINGMRMAVQQT